MKTVCIISDTHGTLGEKVLDCLQGSDHIIHAGDIGTPSILTELNKIAPVTAVLGNCDDAFLIRNVKRRETYDVNEDFVFVITHRPEQLRRDLIELKDYYENKGRPTPKIIGVHGHTHIPKISAGSDAIPANFIVCPGSVSSPRGGWMPTFAKVVIDNGEITSCEIRDLTNEVVFSAKEL